MKLKKFCIGPNMSRMGVLSSNQERNYKLPMVILNTKSGIVPHLMQDILRSLVTDKCIYNLPAQDFVEFTDVLCDFKKGVAGYVGLKSHTVCVTVQNSITPTRPGYNDIRSVSVWGHQGREKIDPQRYTNLIEYMQPDWYEALNDADTDVNSTMKRVEKSMKNTLNFLEQCYDLKQNSKILEKTHFFAPLIGGHVMSKREEWSKIVSKFEVDGYSLLGLHNNGKSAEELELQILGDLTQASLTHINKDKPVQASGAFTPLAILQLVDSGCAIFDSSLPTLATDRGCALIFNCKLDVLQDEGQTSCEENTPAPSQQETNSLEALKRAASVEIDQDRCVKVSKHDEDVDIYCPKYYEINLNDNEYSKSFDPLLKDCSCLTCREFSRAYIHHLLNVKEMLANVLLMIHNVHHWVNFFDSIRLSIENGKLEQLKEVVRSPR